ncbi:MAG: helix-turn-helix domain-containing protein [Cystobacter sp.]
MAFRSHHWKLRIDTEPWEAKTRISAELKRYDWNVSKAAKAMGIARQTLYEYMHELQIERPESPAARGTGPALPPHHAVVAA